VDAEADPEEVVADLEAMLQTLGGLREDLSRYNEVCSMARLGSDKGGAQRGVRVQDTP
jgi:hypothetical protein